MLLILEIMLTVSAWRRGWRWKALIPVAIMMGMAFFGGIAIGASGASITNNGAFVLLDILLVITQAVLSSKAPRQERGQASLEITAHPERA